MRKHPFLLSILLSILLGTIFILIVTIADENWDELVMTLVFGPLWGIFLIYPFVLTIAEIVLLFRCNQKEGLHRQGRWFDMTAIILGVLYSLVFLWILREVEFTSDWQVTLVNSKLHTPVNTQTAITVIVIALIGFAGYCVVNFIPLGKMPPLLMVLGISAMYLGTMESIVWGIKSSAPRFQS